MKKYRMTMLIQAVVVLLFCAVLSLPVTEATENGGGAYPNGAEGFMSGVLPPPGLYIVEYLNHYWANALMNGSGDKVPIDFKLKVSAACTRILWQTNQDFMGGKLGTYVILPIVHGSLDTTFGSSSQNGFGDMTVGPFVSWHFSKNFHGGVAIDIDIPTGAYNKNRSFNIGRNYWTIEPILAATYLGDGGFELSGKFMYDFNFENPDTNYKSGQEFHVDYAMGYHTAPWILGATGYVYRQVTGDSGSGAALGDNKGQVFAIGPSVKYDTKGAIFEARWQKEFAAENKPEGNKIWVKIIWPL